MNNLQEEERHSEKEQTEYSDEDHGQLKEPEDTAVPPQPQYSTRKYLADNADRILDITVLFGHQIQFAILVWIGRTFYLYTPTTYQILLPATASFVVGGCVYYFVMYLSECQKEYMTEYYLEQCTLKLEDLNTCQKDVNMYPGEFCSFVNTWPALFRIMFSGFPCKSNLFNSPNTGALNYLHKVWYIASISVFLFIRNLLLCASVLFTFITCTVGIAVLSLFINLFARHPLLYVRNYIEMYFMESFMESYVHHCR